jgi:hypothetical protein
MRQPLLLSFFVEEGALHNLLGKRDVPPVAERDGVSCCSFKAIITKGFEQWHERYDMGDGSFPLDVRIGEKFLAKEINLLAHRLVDIKLKLFVMHHLGCPLHCMIDVPDLILGGAGEIARPE